MTIPRYLISFDSSKLPTIYTDILVVGSGIAGLRAAIEASKYGRVMVLAKDTLSECNTAYAQALNTIINDYCRNTLGYCFFNLLAIVDYIRENYSAHASDI